ncbi:MAG: glyoxalase, partial [Saprospiraceae bacterium]|nr:glyoxalase [Saprospiraceae bacterium]
MSSSHGTMFPGLRYSDATTAIEWLCNTLGFKKLLVVPDEKGTIVHAQLSLGTGIIMIGSESNNEYGLHVRPPYKLENINTQSPYIYIENIEAHYNHTKSSGADIVIELREEEYGGKHYLVRDPEGHL